MMRFNIEAGLYTVHREKNGNVILCKIARIYPDFSRLASLMTPKQFQATTEQIKPFWLQDGDLIHDKFAGEQYLINKIWYNTEERRYLIDFVKASGKWIAPSVPLKEFINQPHRYELIELSHYG